MGVLQDIGAWFKKVFGHAIKDIDKIAITVTQYIKIGLETGVVQAIAKALDGVTGHISTEVYDFLNKEIPKLLAAELALQGLPENPTEADIIAFENAVLAAIVSKTDQQKSAVWTKLTAQVFILFSDALKANNGHLTFAEIVGIIEQAYQDYLQDVADEKETE